MDTTTFEVPVKDIDAIMRATATRTSEVWDVVVYQPGNVDSQVPFARIDRPARDTCNVHMVPQLRDAMDRPREGRSDMEQRLLDALAQLLLKCIGFDALR